MVLVLVLVLVFTCEVQLCDGHVSACDLFANHLDRQRRLHILAATAAAATAAATVVVSVCFHFLAVALTCC